MTNKQMIERLSNIEDSEDINIGDVIGELRKRDKNKRMEEMQQLYDELASTVDNFIDVLDEHGDDYPEDSSAVDKAKKSLFTIDRDLCDLNYCLELIKEG